MINPGGKKSILVVEDEPGLAILQMKVLARHGFDPVSVYSGEEAVDYISKEKLPDLILMDIRLGQGMDGLAAGKKIRSQVDIPLVFVSSSSDPSLISQAEALSPFGFMVKSAGETALISAVRMALRFQETRKELHRREGSCLKECAIHKPLPPPRPAGLAAIELAARSRLQTASVQAGTITSGTSPAEGSHYGEKVTASSQSFQVDELMHRVKNSFSMLLGMVGMEASGHENKEVKGVLSSLECRIRAFSCLYDLLWSSKNYPSLDRYLSALASTLVSACDATARKVTLETRMETVHRDHMTNLNLGIILVEVIMNCFKYGFSGCTDGHLILGLKQSHEHLELTLHNDGKVPDQAMTRHDKTSTPGFGLTMVRELATQMGGEAWLTHNLGTLFTLRIPSFS